MNQHNAMVMNVENESTKGGDNVTDALELDYAIKKAGLDRPKVAEALGISVTALFNKIHNRTDFKASEIARLKQLLCLSNGQRDRIFFAGDVDTKSTK